MDEFEKEVWLRVYVSCLDRDFAEIAAAKRAEDAVERYKEWRKLQ